MPITLAANVNASSSRISLSGPLTANPGDVYKIDDEIVEVGGFARPSRNASLSRSLLSVKRGRNGTTAASHTTGAALIGAADAFVAGDDETLPDPFATGGIKTIRATLSDAQIKALPTTAVEIIPAPGAGKFILPIVATLRMNWVADYTNINATGLLALDVTGSFLTPVRQTTLSGVSALLAGGGPDGTLLAVTLHALATSTPTPAAPTAHVHTGAADSGFYDADIVNLPLKLSANNLVDGDYTGGDPGNSLIVTVVYTVVDI